MAAILAGLGVDVPAAPDGVLGHPGQIVCGGEALDHDGPAGPGWNDAARRCLLDAHLAGLSAAFASSWPTEEGDPIVEVWLTGPDGVTMWYDATRDAFGSGEWGRSTCERLSTAAPTGADPGPPTAFSCAVPSGVDSVSLAVVPPPAWFTEREALPLCGFAVRVDDVNEAERHCLVDAVNNRMPAEFASVATNEVGERQARWARSIGDGTLQIIESRNAREGAGSVWYRFECSGSGFVEDPDDNEYLLARVDSTCTPVESFPPDASTSITSSPDPTPGGCLGEPIVALVGDADRVRMDLIHYNEHTDSCAYDADGDAMFDDEFRPSSALVVHDGQLAIAAQPEGAVSADVRALEPGMRLAFLDTSPDVQTAASDGTYPIALPGAGCFVVSVGWSAEGRGGQFTGLVESERGICHPG